MRLQTHILLKEALSFFFPCIELIATTRQYIQGDTSVLQFVNYMIAYVLLNVHQAAQKYNFA